jgi:DTW domain-containing protein YfiP
MSVAAETREEESKPVGRPTCATCGRPEVVCYCDAVERLETRTRVVILQHPRERHVRINTARIARLALTNATLHEGIDFSADAEVLAALADPARPAALLFPGEQSVDVRAEPPSGAITLVVLDGTWWQATKLLKANPVLQALPRYAIAPEHLSRYRIRKQPADHCLATIEVLAEVLGVLEGDAERMQRLLAPFDAMVEKQLAWVAKNSGVGGRHRPQRKSKRSFVPKSLRDRPEAVVLASGETNAWPRTEDAPPSELVHWVAVRPATGERFEAFVRASGPLGPKTAPHLRVARELLEAGEPIDAFLARWRAFFREGDVLCMWGHHAGDVLVRQGAEAMERVDLRRVTIDVIGQRTGAIEATAAALGAAIAEPSARGRAGAKLAALEAIAAALNAKDREPEGG